jgi:hypothetical protein
MQRTALHFASRLCPRHGQPTELILDESRPGVSPLYWWCDDCRGAWAEEFFYFRAEQALTGPVQPRSSQAATPEPGKLVFNGLYIGMPIQDVPQALKSHFPDCKIIDDRGRPLSDSRKPHDLSIKMLNPENGMGMRIIGDRSNRVFCLSFFPKTADLATGFEASLTAQEFVEKLKSTYGLPEMSEVANGWKCTNEDGIVFTVNNKKYLNILKPG